MKLELYDDKAKKKAMRTVSGISGVDSIQLDMKDKKLTVIGDIDPVDIVSKLRKQCHTEIVSVGPAKEEKKKEEQPKKDDQKKGDDNKKKDAPKKDEMAELAKLYPYYYNRPPMAEYPVYYHRSPIEEDPNACVIC